MQMQPLVNIPSKPTDKQNRPACAAIVQVGQPPAEACDLRSGVYRTGDIAVNENPYTRRHIKDEKGNESIPHSYAVCGCVSDGRMLDPIASADGALCADAAARDDGSARDNRATRDNGTVRDNGTARNDESTQGA